MLKNLIIFSFCILAINASGELNILKAPKSLDFKGNEKLDSENLGDVVSASLGNWVDDALKWSGVYINDPFSTPKNALVFIFEGIDHINLNKKVKSYPLTGSSSSESMNGVSSEFESSNIQAAFVDFTQLTEALETMAEVTGEVPAQIGNIKPTNNLKPDLHTADNDFLTYVEYCELWANKLATTEQPALVTFRFKLDPIAEAHGEKSAAMADAKKIVADLVERLSSKAKPDTLVIAVAEKAEANRAKREAVSGDSVKSLNLATYYSEDYPVIFNIILWFMVVLGFSILAICYAIGSMDPGRDSIIYRMTSTRMKKDN